MILQEMNRNNRLIVFISILFLISNNSFAQRQFSAGHAAQMVEKTYLRLNSYAGIISKYNGTSIETKTLKDDVVECFDTACIIEMDIYRLFGKKEERFTSQRQTLSFYLQKVEEIAKNKEVNFVVKGKPFFDNNNQEIVATIEVTSTGNSYRCKAKIGFNENLKIRYIKYSNYENIPNIEIQEQPEPPIISCSHIYLSAGWKITNGVNWGVGIDGISKNWFINHLRFGVECNMLFNQEGEAHYPTSSDGTSSTMTYRTRENDDYGLGINIGYRIIPGKYDNVSILGGPGRLFFSMGGGIIRYGRWWEYQGTAEPIKHPRNTAFYIKPSLTLEYLLSDRWGIGIEASYYYSPQYSQINGVSLNLIFNYAF